MFLVSVLETHREQVKGGLSMFLESVRQEMPSAHLELLYSGSLRVTGEAFEVLPGRLSHQTFFVPLIWSMWPLPAFYSWPNYWFQMRFGDWMRQCCSWNPLIKLTNTNKTVIKGESCELQHLLAMCPDGGVEIKKTVQSRFSFLFWPTDGAVMQMMEASIEGWIKN